MPILEAPNNLDDESSPENSLVFIGEHEQGQNNDHVLQQTAVTNVRQRIPEPANVMPEVSTTIDRYGAIRLPTLRLQNEGNYIESVLEDPALHLSNNGTWLRITPEPPPVVNLLPMNLPPQMSEPQLDELLRRVTQRNDLHNVETVRLRVISAITMSLSRLSLFLPCLQHLDLSGSVLNSLRDLGCGLVHLTYLNVSNCGLNSFDGTSGMAAVTVLVADGNMIQRVGPLSQLPLLQRLSAQNNRISDLGLLTFLGMCPHLTQVELQGNPVCHLSFYRITLQRSVRTLELLDGMPIGSQHAHASQQSIANVNSLGETAQSQSEISRVEAYNHRNTFDRGSSTASTGSSSVSSSSLSLSLNNTNSEEVFSLSSNESVGEQHEQQATDVTNEPNLFSPVIQDHLKMQESESNITECTTSAPSPALNLMASPLIYITRQLRPATAPAYDATPQVSIARQHRPASALGASTYTNSSNRANSGITNESTIVSSIFDLARCRRRRLRSAAWASQSSSQTFSTASTSSSVSMISANDSPPTRFASEPATVETDDPIERTMQQK